MEKIKPKRKVITKDKQKIIFGMCLDSDCKCEVYFDKPN